MFTFKQFDAINTNTCPISSIMWRKVLLYSKNTIKAIGKCDRSMHMLELELSKKKSSISAHKTNKDSTLVARFLFQLSRADDTIFPAHNYSDHLN
jgi:hypothetical protein